MTGILGEGKFGGIEVAMWRQEPGGCVDKDRRHSLISQGRGGSQA